MFVDLQAMSLSVHAEGDSNLCNPTATNYVVQEPGVVTLKVMSRPGRITMAGHIMTIVRNILGEDAASGVGKIRMLSENGEEVCK